MENGENLRYTTFSDLSAPPDPHEETLPYKTFSGLSSSPHQNSAAELRGSARACAAS